MREELILTPEELYYLGKILRAKYIDYAYVAALKNIGSNVSLFINETRASLIEKGIIEEDFSGNAEIDPEVCALLKPVFFGEYEFSVNIRVFGEHAGMSVCKYHYLDAKAVSVSSQENGFLVKAVDVLELRKEIKDIYPDSIVYEKKTVSELPKTDIERLITVKGLNIGKSAAVINYIQTSHGFYQVTGDETLETVEKSVFVKDVSEMIGGSYDVL